MFASQFYPSYHCWFYCDIEWYSDNGIFFFLFKDQQLLTESVPRSLGQVHHASGQGRPLQFPLLTPPVAAMERHSMYRVADIHRYILDFWIFCWIYLNFILNQVKFYVKFLIEVEFWLHRVKIFCYRELNFLL